MGRWSFENWHPSHFGEDDEIGALGPITPGSILKALGIVGGRTRDGVLSPRPIAR
jgi:hypothetical protein